jgi:hypothetical protein
VTVYRLAVRQLGRNVGGSILSIIALALPSTALLALALDSREPLLAVVGGAPFAALALALVGAMVGSALLLSFRRNERTLALLASVGAPPNTVAAVVSTSGLVLGGAAAIIAVAAGSVIGGFVIDGPDLLTVAGIAAGTVLVGWLAALAPATSTRSLDITAVLRNAPRENPGRWLNVRAGRILVAVGLGLLLVVAIAGAIALPLPEGLPRVLLRAAAALAQPAALLLLIGVVLTLPAVFRWFASRARGVAARLAARDAERSGVRSASVATIVVASTALLSAYLCLGTASAASSIANYAWEFQEGQAGISLIEIDGGAVSTRTTVGDSDEVVSILGAEDGRVLSGALGPYWGSPVDEFEGYSGRQEYRFPQSGLPLPRLSDESVCTLPRDETGLDDFDCSAHPYYFELRPDLPSVWVGDAADLALMLGRAPDAATAAVLAAGEAVVLDPRYLGTDGTVDLDWWGARQFVPEDEPGEFLPAGTPVRTASLPAVFADPGHPVAFDLIVGPATAERLELDVVPALVLGTAPPTAAETESVQRELTAVGSNLWLQVERGPGTGFDPAWRWGAVALAGGLIIVLAFVSIGLSRLEGSRTDQALAAVGASPGIRRRITGWYTLLVVGASAVTGTAVGALTAASSWLALASPGTIDRTLVFPVVELGLIGLAVPLLVTLGALLLPHGRSGRPRPE